MDPITQFELLSDAAQLAVIGGLFWAFALFAGMMERRRAKSRDVARLEQVGWVPWMGLFMLAAILGGGCLAMSLPAVIGGLKAGLRASAAAGASVAAFLPAPTLTGSRDVPSRRLHWSAV